MSSDRKQFFVVPLDEAGVPLFPSRTQTAGPVTVTLDGDAYLREWTPNLGGDGWEIDLTPLIADLIDSGLGQPPVPAAHWRSDATTVIMQLDVGQRGEVRIDDQPISEEAAVRLAVAGWERRLEDALVDGEPVAEAAAKKKSTTKKATPKKAPAKKKAAPRKAAKK